MCGFVIVWSVSFFCVCDLCVIFVILRNLGAIEERKELLTEKICRFDREEKLRVSKEKALTLIFM
jgi:hypothetical protein